MNSPCDNSTENFGDESQAPLSTNCIPMTPAEKSIYATELLFPDNVAYLVQVTLPLYGKLQLDYLVTAVQGLGRRHNVLLSTYQDNDGYTRVVNRELVLSVEVHHSSDPIEIAQRSASRPFDLAREAPFRAHIVVVSADKAELILTMHHIVCDAASIPILLRSIEEDYNSLTTKSAVPDRISPVTANTSPADYRPRARKFVTSLPTTTPLQLPADKPRPKKMSLRGRTQEFHISAELYGRIRDAAREHRTTAFCIIASAFGALLARCCNQDAFLIGVPTDGRPSCIQDDLVGCYANLVPMALDCRGGSTVSELISRTRSQTANVVRNRDLPFDDVLAVAGVDRDPAKPPMISVALQLLYTEPIVLEFDGLEPTVLQAKMLGGSENSTAKLDMSLELIADGDDRPLMCSLEYSVDLFDEDTVRRWVERLVVVLEQVVSEPQKLVVDLEVMTDSERQLVTVGWNDTVVPFPREMTLWDLFIRQARRTPDAVAVSSAGCGVQWSYGELSQRANAVAGGLIERGVGRGSRVAVCMARSPEVVAVLLGILGAGAAYVPLDSSHPAQRLAFMATNADVCLTVVDAEGQQALSDVDVGTVPAAALLNGPADEVIARAATPIDLAYIIYTSGSTGRPKGVMVEHHSIVNYIQSMQHHFPLESRDRFLQGTALSFDVSAYEIFWPLSIGAEVAVLADHYRTNMVEIARIITSESITALHLVPSLMQLLVSEMDLGPRRRPTLRYAFVSGEPLKCELARTARGRLRCPLTDLYGATEVSVDSTWHTVETDDMHVGKPMANQRVYVLDERLKPVPVGTFGQVVLGGACVSRGYVGQPELTADRFVIDPFSEEPDARMYCTGDIGRWTSKGNIELRGRSDSQIKLHGVRVEPGEVEAALLRIPSLTGAAVAVRGSGARAKLIAYITTSADSRNEEEIQLELAKLLPQVMIPHRFVVLPEFPRLTSGKIDHSALPEPDANPADTDSIHMTEAESAVAGHWSEILGRPITSPRANFFRGDWIGLPAGLVRSGSGSVR